MPLGLICCGMENMKLWTFSRMTERKGALNCHTPLLIFSRRLIN